MSSSHEKPVWDDAFWPRLQGPHASRLAARIRLPGDIDWTPCAVLDIGPGGCGVRLEEPGLEPPEGARVTIELKPAGSDRVLRTMAVRSLTSMDLDESGEVDASKVIGLEVLGEPLPDAALMPEGQLEIELAELDLLTEHAQRMWQAEQDNHNRLSLRGRVVVGSTSALLGFIAIGIVVAGADSKLNLLPDASWAAAVMWVGLMLACGIALGLMLCIGAVANYVWHAEEDSGVLWTRSDFGHIGKHHFDTQPTLYSIYAPYLFDVMLRDRQRWWWKRMLARRSCRRAGLEQATRWWREFLLHHAYGCTDEARLPAHQAIELDLRVARWKREQRRWLLLPVIRPARFVSRAIHLQYHDYIRTYYEEKQRRQDHVLAMERGHASEHGYGEQFARLVTDSKLNPIYAEPLTRASSYYLQFAEGFCRRYLGRERMAEEGTGRDGIAYFDLDRLSPALSTLRPVGWRVFTSTYFSAQQLRSANWNLWYRVRKSERRFALGLGLVAVCFALNALLGIVVQRMAVPIAPVEVRLQDGALRIEYAGMSAGEQLRDPQPSGAADAP